MVFEQLFRLNWIEKKEHSFFLGLVYSFVAIISATVIFPSNVGLMSIAFTSILLVPTLMILLSAEENIEIREKKLSLTQLFKDHKDIFKVYLFLFLGIFTAYCLVILAFPISHSQAFFSTQLTSSGIHGFAATGGTIKTIIANNLLVFVVCFLLSLVYGAGSILFLTWNASVWGVAFAFVAKQIALSSGDNPFVQFSTFMLPFLPHMITEAVAYISAAIVGGVVSKAVLREHIASEKFHHILSDSFIFLALGIGLVVIAAVIEVQFI